jgi:cell pole-organizing protein PopZ
MSGSNNEIANNGGPVSSAEPSMEEILASIRRILKDDQSTQPGDSEPEEEVLVLDSTMVVRPGTSLPSPIEPITGPEAAPEFPQPEPMMRETAFEPGTGAPTFDDEPQSQPHLDSASSFDSPPLEPNEIETASHEFQAETFAASSTREEQDMSDNAQEHVQSPDGLVSDAASNAAAGSIGALIRSISSDRQIAIGRAGLTLEDLVREELRPLLKSWLDTNLPALVERIVRAEIQRVIERSTA